MEATGSVDSSESRQGEESYRESSRGAATLGGRVDVCMVGRNRRLSKDYERIIVSSEATIKFANIALLLWRLEPNKNTPKLHYRDILQKALVWRAIISKWHLRLWISNFLVYKCYSYVEKKEMEILVFIST